MGDRDFDDEADIFENPPEDERSSSWHDPYNSQGYFSRLLSAAVGDCSQIADTQPLASPRILSELSQNPVQPSAVPAGTQSRPLLVPRQSPATGFTNNVGSQNLGQSPSLAPTQSLAGSLPFEVSAVLQRRGQTSVLGQQQAAQAVQHEPLSQQAAASLLNGAFQAPLQSPGRGRGTTTTRGRGGLSQRGRGRGRTGQSSVAAQQLPSPEADSVDSELQECGPFLSANYGLAESLALVDEYKHLEAIKHSSSQSKMMTESVFWLRLRKGMLQRQWDGKQDDWNRSSHSLQNRWRALKKEYQWLHDHNEVTPSGRATYFEKTKEQRDEQGLPRTVLMNSPELFNAIHEVQGSKATTQPPMTCSSGANGVEVTARVIGTLEDDFEAELRRELRRSTEPAADDFELEDDIEDGGLYKENEEAVAAAAAASASVPPPGSASAQSRREAEAQVRRPTKRQAIREQAKNAVDLSAALQRSNELRASDMKLRSKYMAKRLEYEKSQAAEDRQVIKEGFANLAGALREIGSQQLPQSDDDLTALMQRAQEEMRRRGLL
ncbi:hypothetical protein COCOBI_12-3970 [Coccomyxa sp. Obi]|nr:hypothetical protein COCOBI_12-3970 [Coccomyxa sp. Obi]